MFIIFFFVIYTIDTALALILPEVWRRVICPLGGNIEDGAAAHFYR
jgi:hypothetical protein